VELVCSNPIVNINPLIVLVLDDATEEPIADASVLILSTAFDTSVVDLLTTEATGKVSWFLTIGSHVFFAGKRGYAVASTRLEVAENRTDLVNVELRLAKGQRVSGRVVDQSGLAVAGAQVAVVGAQWNPITATAVLTAADGSFTLDSLPGSGGSIGVISKGIADGITSVMPGQRDVVLIIQR
jgi:hypothetical protein